MTIQQIHHSELKTAQSDYRAAISAYETERTRDTHNERIVATRELLACAALVLRDLKAPETVVNAMASCYRFPHLLPKFIDKALVL